MALVAQRVERVAHALGFGLARVAECLIGQRDGAADLVAQLLGSHRTPVGRAHVLHQQVHRLATPFAGDQHPVGLLFGAVVAQPQVDQAPAEVEAGNAVITILRDEIRRRQMAVVGVSALADVIVAAPVVARGGQHLGQHVELGDVELLHRQRLFHHLGAAIQVVLQRTRHGLVQCQRALQRLHALTNGLPIGLIGRREALAAERCGVEGRATCERHDAQGCDEKFERKPGGGRALGEGV